MKKNIFSLFMILLFIGCNQNTAMNFDEISNEIAMNNDLNEFRENINYVAFDYDIDFRTFSCKINESIFTIKIADIEIFSDSLKIPFTVANKNYIKHGTVYKEIKNDQSGILLSFDDYYSTWDDVLSIFKENHIFATWFVKGGTVTDFILNANKDGQCIGYHTKNHTMLKYLSKDTYDNYIDKFDWECIHFLGVFRQAGIPMKTFAIPHGNGLIYDWQIKRLYSKGHIQIIRDFDPNFHLYTAEEIKSGYISSQSIDNNKFTDDEEFKSNILERLLITKMTQKIYPCTSHTFSDDVGTGGGYSLTYDRLYYLFEVIKNLQLKTYTFEDFCE